MAPARTRMLALAAGLLFAFAIGTYYGRDHIYEHVSRWSGKNGFRPILSDEHGNMFASPKQGKSPAGPAFENYDSLPIGSKTQQRANAAFVVLVRNQGEKRQPATALRQSVRQLADRHRDQSCPPFWNQFSKLNIALIANSECPRGPPLSPALT